MIKKALKSAVGISIGITIGGVIIPRLFMFKNLYNETYPPVFVHSMIYFVGSYMVCFLFFILLEWIKSKI